MKAANLSKLQRIQNAAARVVKNFHPFSRQSISPVLKELHWLKVNERIKYKLATMMHNCVEGTAPESLMAKMPARCSNNTRQHSARKFVLPKTKTNAGKRTFSYAAATVWNELPATITAATMNFRSQLKTWLFNISHPP